MVWLAASGCTIILAFVLYKYYVATEPHEKEHLETAAGSRSDLFNKSVESKALTSNGDVSNEAKLEQPQEHQDYGNTQDKKGSALPSPIPGERADTPVPTILPPTVPSSSPPRLKPPTFSPMLAPPRPNNATSLRPPPSAASSLRVQPTSALSYSSMAPASTMPRPKGPSRKVILRPGHSPLDWAMLTSAPNHKLRGNDVPEHLIRVSPSQLEYHHGRNGREAWTAFQGKVYNVTPYLSFHPGGEGELLRGAAKDSAQLFMGVHPWVNWEGMLGECLVGILVGEGEDKESVDTKSGGLDSMD